MHVVQKLALATAIVALLGSRLIPGPGMERPEDQEALCAAAAKFAGVPGAVGPWQGEAPLTLTPEVIQVGRLAGYVWRRYRHCVTGDAVTVLLVCGSPEPIALHGPDVCYRGIGYRLVGQPLPCTVRPPLLKQPAEFWTASFRKASATIPEQIRIYWSWNARGTWEAAESPLRTFASSPFLYKLYVVSDATRAESEAPGDKDPCKDFMNLFLPELQKSLFSEATPDQR
jgi:hypothetical protein